MRKKFEFSHPLKYAFITIVSIILRSIGVKVLGFEDSMSRLQSPKLTKHVIQIHLVMIDFNGNLIVRSGCLPLRLTFLIFTQIS